MKRVLRIAWRWPVFLLGQGQANKHQSQPQARVKSRQKWVQARLQTQTELKLRSQPGTLRLLALSKLRLELGACPLSHRYQNFA